MHKVQVQVLNSTSVRFVLRVELVLEYLPWLIAPNAGDSIRRGQKMTSQRQNKGEPEGSEFRSLVEGRDVEAVSQPTMRKRQLPGKRQHDDDDTPFCCFPLKVLVAVGFLTFLFSLYIKGK
jgi:hypothetical protein